MADTRTLRNEGEITINRTIVNEDETTTSTVSVGNYYFSVSRELKQMTLQLFLNETITNEDEKQQIADKYKSEYLSLIEDSTIYGWDILDVRDSVEEV